MVSENSMPTTIRTAPSLSNQVGPTAARAHWLVSPLFDLLFLVNAWWLVAFVPGFLSAERTPHIEFWQIYFLTAPHRWITLFLVATDPDRRAGRSWLFAAVAILGLLIIVGVRFGTGGFLCLLLVDYVWNAWHFAAQHAGILRMYSRKEGGGLPWLETWGIRSIVFYTSIRLAGWSYGWTENWPAAQTALLVCDVLMAMPVLALLARELSTRPWQRLGKVAYALSVALLYLSLLTALTTSQTVLVLSLTVAAAAFHAVEYLAVVTYYAQRRRTQGSPGIFRTMARSWGLILSTYVVIGGLIATVADQWSHDFWLGINLWAAGLHYAYDGLIWKLRAPNTAAVLDVQLSPSTQQNALLSATPIPRAAQQLMATTTEHP